MHLVDDEDDVSGGLRIADESKHSRLKLTAELRSGDERGHIDEIDLLAL